jgi:2-aminomuconate deaminase
MATIRRFEDLEIWQIARRLNKEIIELTKTTELKRDFGLKDQIMRSSESIMNNIAEGFGRAGRLEFIHFLSITRGSANELKSQLTQGLDKKYITEIKFNNLITETEKLNNKTAAFINYLNYSKYKGLKFMNRETTKDSNDSNNKQQITNDSNNTNNKQQTTNNNDIVKTTNAATPLGAYPHARKVGNLLFLSGIGSRRASDNQIPGLKLDEQGNILAYDIEAECLSVFANVKAVLEASGSSWDKIVDVTVFLTNRKADFPIYNRIYADYFKDVEACRTTVEIKSLPTPIAIELKVIATID